MASERSSALRYKRYRQTAFVYSRYIFILSWQQCKIRCMHSFSKAVTSEESSQIRRALSFSCRKFKRPEISVIFQWLYCPAASDRTCLTKYRIRRYCKHSANDKQLDKKWCTVRYKSKWCSKAFRIQRGSYNTYFQKLLFKRIKKLYWRDTYRTYKTWTARKQ